MFNVKFSCEYKHKGEERRAEYALDLGGLLADLEAAARRLPRSSAELIRELYREVRSDINAVCERDPAARNKLEVLLLYSGVHAILAYRVSHKLYLGHHYFPARLISQLAKFFTGVEIHPGARIGERFVIDHGTGVVIGETSEIGEGCTVYQGVTLGGTGKDVGKRHPTVGSNVMIGAGAKVLGPLNIGDNVKIAAGAVVLGDIPSGSTAVGIPAKVVRRDGVRINDDLDQVHIPDPVAAELLRLENKISELEQELGKIKGEDKNV